jgi:hypothetical protein
MTGLTPGDLDQIFTSHVMDEAQTSAAKLVREKAHELAALLLTVVPPSPEQTIAIRSVQEASMFAVAAISKPRP